MTVTRSLAHVQWQKTLTEATSASHRTNNWVDLTILSKRTITFLSPSKNWLWH